MALLLEADDCREYTAPLHSASVPSQSYVLSIATLSNHYVVSASAPINTIEVFDKTSLHPVQSLPGHDVAITSLKAVSSLVGLSGECIVSSGQDCAVKIWDGRSTSHCIKLTDTGGTRPILCCDVSPDGSMIAAGSSLKNEDAVIYYWDPRQPTTPLRTHSSTHSDDVTGLHFSASGRALLSGSSDGLVSISSAFENDEDEAVEFVANWGCSVSQLGWAPASPGANASNVWAASDMETFSLWSSELDPIYNIDIRRPVLHGHSRTWVTDYLIGCQPVPSALDSRLGVFVGTNDGDIALLDNVAMMDSEFQWQIKRLWTTCHSGIVRSVLWDEKNQVLLSGGEDSKINIWSIKNSNSPDPTETDTPVSPRRKHDMDWEYDEQQGKKARR
ncbi:WD40 repeat-like protein [Fistulina hepatica ATCC 64428]|uniref:WD40 repeat-like protein n=1 Tax=Fistulina hepatica ATCC 64428 TaxID=1128425 RepID=A0A0D7A5J4_9AGAR|nr:WD40 repeat-like protein [Fistulina hepatica ATCC 64428]